MRTPKSGYAKLQIIHYKLFIKSSIFERRSQEIEVEDLSLKHSNIKYAENAAARTGNAEAYNDGPASADVESASQLDGAGE